MGRYRVADAVYRWVCEECEGIWDLYVRKTPDSDLPTLLESLGLSPLWDHLQLSDECLG